MARLTKADSVYRMSLHKNGGYMYATTHPYTVTGDGTNKAKTIPHLAKISKLKGVVCVYKLKPKTITAPPNNIYKLL